MVDITSAVIVRMDSKLVMAYLYFTDSSFDRVMKSMYKEELYDSIENYVLFVCHK